MSAWLAFVTLKTGRGDNFDGVEALVPQQSLILDTWVVVFEILCSYQQTF